MQEITFKIEGPHIELLALLKATSIAQTGGHAKFIVDDGDVIRNGEREYRRRAKIIPTDVLEIGGEIKIILT